MNRSSRFRWLLVVAVFLVAAVYWWRQPPQAPAGAPASAATDGGVATIEEAYRAGRSDTWVESGGIVERTLADDEQGSRHQRFILRLTPDLTLLISHNIDLAPRLPLQVGDRVRFRGEYEWNDRGGVVHWTHHDPDGRLQGGWIEHEGQRYE